MDTSEETDKLLNMAATLATPEKVHDRELLAWLSGDGDEKQELIVEAAVPRRKVSFRAVPDGRLLPATIGGSAKKKAILEELASYLTELLHTRPTLLRAAGAFAVRATGSEAERLLDHPLVRSVRLNRRLRPELPRHEAS